MSGWGPTHQAAEAEAWQRPKEAVNGLRISVVWAFPTWWGRNFPPDVLEREDAGSFAGGETHMLEGALGLGAAGHVVTVYADLIRPSTFRGVSFKPEREFQRDAIYAPPADVTIAYMHPGPLAAAPPGSVRLFAQQCNDLGFTWSGGAWQALCDAVIAASASHAAYLSFILDGQRTHFEFPGPYEVVHNGCYFERYPEPPPPQARPPVVAYWSSPDRGLHHLLRAWPHVLRIRPDARLRIHYEVERVFRELMASFPHLGVAPDPGLMRLEMLRDEVMAAKRLPSIEWTGMLSRPALRRAQCETRVMCYPLDPALGYTEGMGSSVSEAMAAGALPLLCPVDCFPSVYSGACRWIEGDPAKIDYPKLLAEQIVAALDWTGDTPSTADLRACAKRWSWHNARAEYVRVVDRAVARKRDLPVPPPAFPLESIAGPGSGA